MSAASLYVALQTLAWLGAGAYGVAVLERWIVPEGGGARGVRALVQPLASGARLLRAGVHLPTRPDGALFRSAPVVALAAVALAAWAVPWSATPAVDTPVTLFFFLILLSPFAVALANAGWGANGKYGLVASMRAISHLVAYEVVLGFGILGPAMAAESLSLARIAAAQERLWYVVWQPLGLLIYLASALFATYRRPFDTPIAGSELMGGSLAEYAGPGLLLFRAAYAALLFVVAAAGAVLYLGGWRGPPGVGPLLPGPVWMVLKTYALVALVLWVGGRTPRLGHDEMLRFSWKVVLPVAFMHIAVTGVLILVLEP